MSEYHKIQTVFKRDPATKHKTLLWGEFATPEFEYLADLEWTFTEKVDGTNIRVMHDGDGGLSVGGKTDRAQIPANLFQHLREVFLSDPHLYMLCDGAAFTLYGEGFGAGIQKGGNYGAAQRFVLFDVRVGDMWLQREDVEDIAGKLSVPVVPVIGRGTLIDIARIAHDGFNSTWGDFQAEGIVARPAVELVDRRGNRIITKVKCKDFNHNG